MKSFLLFTALFFSSFLYGQHVLLVGNTAAICTDSATTLTVVRNDSLDSNLQQYDAILIFSGARSPLTSCEVERLLHYVENGGGLYCGADNAPLQYEFNLVTNHLFAREAWGNFSNERAEVSELSFLHPVAPDSVDAGNTTTAIPLDARMRVEAWIEDQPLIASYRFGRGVIVFDGGYSRFYCPIRNENKRVLEAIIRFLSSDHTD